MYINHLTLSTGHLSRIERGDVSGETLARVRPWLAAVTASGGTHTLPVSALSDYTASAVVVNGALIVSVFAPNGAPLVSIGVAKRSRHGAPLWEALTGPQMPPAAPGISQPSEPWCAALLWPTLAANLSAARWLGDFERCVAWAWCTRPVDGPEDEQ